MFSFKFCESSCYYWENVLLLEKHLQPEVPVNESILVFGPFSAALSFDLFAAFPNTIKKTPEV